MVCPSHSQAVKLCFPTLFHKVPGESTPVHSGFVEPPAEPTDDAESLFCCSGLFSSLQLERGLPQLWGLSCHPCFIPSAWQILGARSMGISRMRGLIRKGRVGGVFGHLVRSVPEACEGDDVLLSGSGFTVRVSETEHAGGPLVTPCFSFPLRWWRTGSWETRRGRLRKCFTAHCVSRSSCASTGWRLTWRRIRITR